MTKILSIINLKGGVGKSTITVALADILSSEFRKRVLVIDLDPQTNSTIMFIGEQYWKFINQQNKTLATVFKHALNGSEGPPDINEILLKDISQTRNRSRYWGSSVDLIPSSLDLISLQDNLANVDTGPFHERTPSRILSQSMIQLLEKQDDTAYDFVLIDCPPNLGIITLNGLRLSDAYVIPTIPDVLSTYGIPQIINRVQEFSKEIEKSIPPIGIVINKFRYAGTLHNSTVEDLESNEHYPPVLEPIIVDNIRFSAAAEPPTWIPVVDEEDKESVSYWKLRSTQTVRQKWGPGYKTQSLIQLTENIKNRLEELE